MKTKQFYFLVAACVATLLSLPAAPVLAQNGGMWRTNGNNNAANGQFIGTTDSSPLVFKTNDVERMRIIPNGGLQVSSLSGTQPAVLGVKPDGSLFRLDAPGVDTAFSCNNRLYGAAGNYLTPNCVIGSINAAPFRVITNNAERMRVTEFGTIGIGTVNPQSPLHIYSSNGAELRVETGQVNAFASLGLWASQGQSIKLGTVSARLDNALTPEMVLAVNSGSGLTTMQNVMRLDATSAQVYTRLGVGTAPLAQDQLSVNGTTLITQAGNPNNWLRLGRNASDATVEVGGGNSGINFIAPSGMASLQQASNPGNYVKIGHNGTTAILEASGGANGKLFVNPGGVRTDFGGTVIMNQNLGIGTANFTDPGNGKDYRLSVSGRIRCTEVKVYSGWADHVFGADYKLMPLGEVDAYIAANGHLPGVPSATEVEANGVELGATQALLLEKIEELTLHMIQLQKENAELRADVDAMK